MALGFGLLSAQLRPGETDWLRPYDETVRVAVEAERLGFDSVWTTEHHFVDDGYMPSLLVVSAAIAAATTTIDIGTGVILAPLHHPLRLAEDAATVQLLSGGRLVLGLGLGWSATEFEGLGSDIRRRGAAMEEILQILDRAWSGQVFRHQGRVYDLPELAVRPVPFHPIPILIGGGAEPAIRRAARLASGLFSNAPVEALVRQVEWARDELDRIGRDPATFRIVHYSVMLPGSSTEQALERYGDDLWHMSWKYSDMEASARRPGPPPPAPPLDDANRSQVFGRSTIAGSGEQIVEALLAIRRRSTLPVDFAARSYFATLSLQDQFELMEHLAREVAPHL
jgi:probable F420-dependent oxidoreductase